MTPMTFVLQDFRDKSHLLNIIDTPGHPNFSDEVSAAYRAVDGVLLVVDAIEGVMSMTERAIKQALEEGLEIVVVLNKIDRLIIELKFPLNDAYHKIKHTLEEINYIISTFDLQTKQKTISPTNGNVIFASALFGACFTLQSFATLYTKQANMGAVDPKNFARFLWGDLYFDEDTRKFTRKATKPD
jgi:U5 small nuclear ribonucleoprotein component